jgi:hypothetical protein
MASAGFVGPRNKKNNKKAKRNMKNIIKTVLYLQMAALCFATAFADPNLKEKDLRGSILSVETADIDFVTLIMLVDGSGTGRAKHLGQFTYTYEFVVDLSSTGIGIGVGSAEFTAANGDSFSTTTTGLGVTVAPGVDRVVEQHLIVGGTGRFAGASGSFILDRLITHTTNVSVGTVDGTIVTSKSK